eukprot:3049520-Pyramimonas_sp.AAC.1
MAASRPRRAMDEFGGVSPRCRPRPPRGRLMRWAGRAKFRHVAASRAGFGEVSPCCRLELA